MEKSKGILALSPQARNPTQTVSDQAVAHERIIGAVINSPNEMMEPGVVVHTGPHHNALLLGKVDDRQSDRLANLRSVLEDARIGSPVVPELRFELWSMLALLTGHPISVVRKERAMGNLFMRLASEASSIAAAHGFDLSSSFKPDALIPNAPDHTPSVRQDYDRGSAPHVLVGSQ